jgi:hypothetical protein
MVQNTPEYTWFSSFLGALGSRNSGSYGSGLLLSYYFYRFMLLLGAHGSGYS